MIQILTPVIIMFMTILYYLASVCKLEKIVLPPSHER